jgi:hypothetical protein
MLCSDGSGGSGLGGSSSGTGLGRHATIMIASGEPHTGISFSASSHSASHWELPLVRMTPDDERSGDLLDVALRDEIELVSDLVVAASSSPRHFTPAEVDALLGIGSAPRRDSDRSASPDTAE